MKRTCYCSFIEKKRKKQYNIRLIECVWNESEERVKERKLGRENALLIKIF